MKENNPVGFKLAVFDVNNQGMFEVHTADCADCEKVKSRTGLKYHVGLYHSKTEVCEEIYSDMIQDGSMTVEDGFSDIVFKPCIRNLPYGRNANANV